MRRRQFLGSLVLVVVVVVTLVAVIYLRQKPPVFAIVPQGINHPYSYDIRAGCMNAAEQLGVTCEFAGSSQIDSASQIQVLEDLIRRRVAGLAVSPVDAESIVPSVKKARAAGIPVITFESDAPPESGRLAFVGASDEIAGTALANLFRRLAPKGATYGIITGTLDARDLAQRIVVVRRVLKGKAQYKEIDGSPFPTNGDISLAVQVVEQVIRANPNLTGIIMLGGWALLDPEGYKRAMKTREGAVRAGQFVVVAFDFQEPSLKLVKEGWVSGLVDQRPFQMGQQSIRLLHDLVTKKITPAETAYNSGVRIVTKENVHVFVR